MYSHVSMLSREKEMHRIESCPTSIRSPEAMQDASHHEAAKGVHLSDEGAFGQATNAGVAAHLPDAGPWCRGDQQCGGTSPGGGCCSLTACGAAFRGTSSMVQW